MLDVRQEELVAPLQHNQMRCQHFKGRPVAKMSLAGQRFRLNELRVQLLSFIEGLRNANLL